LENIGSKYKGGDLVRRIHSPHSGLLDLILLVSIVFAVLVIGLSRISYADDLKNSDLTISVVNLKLETVTSNTEQKMARSGCCSWHSGVCDCIGGRVVCCDGTFSPTCTCHHDSNKDVLNSKE
jgi:hypothetical protein